jgi:hypothetical protein
MSSYELTSRPMSNWVKVGDAKVIRAESMERGFRYRFCWRDNERLATALHVELAPLTRSMSAQERFLRMMSHSSQVANTTWAELATGVAS